MATLRLQTEQDRVDAEVPPSLLDFIVKWAKHGEHAQEHCVMSLLSHGLMHLCIVNPNDQQLHRVVRQVQEDLVRYAPSDAVVLEVEGVTLERCASCLQYH